MMAGLAYILVIYITFFKGETHVVKGSAAGTGVITQASISNTICTDCIKMLELFKDMLILQDPEEQILEMLKIFCKRLPGSERRSQCVSLLQERLPEVYLTSQMKRASGDVCMGLGMCGLEPTTRGSARLLGNDESNLLPEISPNQREVQIGPQCTFCVLLMKKLESMLPKKRTKEAIVKVMGEVCHLLPSSFRSKCNSFMNKYGKRLIDFLLSSAAPHTICVMLHQCLSEEAPVPEMPLPSDCESCCTLAALGRLHLGVNTSASHASSFLQLVCLQHPGAIPKCEVFTTLHRPTLQRVLLSRKDECQRTDLCESAGPQRLLGEDVCSWGPKYRCRDRKTAVQCGTVAFCEMFFWK